MTLSLSLNAGSLACQHQSIEESLALLEKETGGHIGVSALNTGNYQRIDYHADERFPLCSTGKVMAVAAILQKSTKQPELLTKKIHYSQQEIESAGYTPITEHYQKQGMTIAELCDAAITHSDNLAMNLLIQTLGDTQAVSTYARTLNNQSFRLDRTEPTLNSAIPNDLRDTVTPRDMQTSLYKLAILNALPKEERETFQRLLKNNTTGQKRIRAGVPSHWMVGDKTGTGGYGTTNDIGIVWPPHCPPIVMAVYFTQTNQSAQPRDEVIATVSQLVIDEFRRKDMCLFK